MLPGDRGADDDDNYVDDGYDKYALIANTIYPDLRLLSRFPFRKLGPLFCRANDLRSSCLNKFCFTSTGGGEAETLKYSKEQQHTSQPLLSRSLNHLLNYSTWSTWCYESLDHMDSDR